MSYLCWKRKPRVNVNKRHEKWPIIICMKVQAPSPKKCEQILWNEDEQSEMTAFAGYSKICSPYIYQGTTRDNLNQEEELTTPDFGNSVQKKYVEFRELDLFTDLTLRIENKYYKVKTSIEYHFIFLKYSFSWHILHLACAEYLEYFCRSMTVFTPSISTLTDIEWGVGDVPSSLRPFFPHSCHFLWREKMVKYRLKNTGSAIVFHDSKYSFIFLICRFTKS